MNIPNQNIKGKIEQLRSDLRNSSSLTTLPPTFRNLMNSSMDKKLSLFADGFNDKK